MEPTQKSPGRKRLPFSNSKSSRADDQDAGYVCKNSCGRKLHTSRSLLVVSRLAGGLYAVRRRFWSCYRWKTLANCYNIPLVNILRRTNNGCLCIYFMGFIPLDDTEGFGCFFLQFIACMGVSPRVWACDQDFAIISAIQCVVPDVLVILDDWHLNQNQKRNTAKYTSARGSSAIAPQMTHALHRLRSGNSETQFLGRREAFESLNFAESPLPRWYSKLYHFNPELVSKCFNRTTCDPRFFFQDSGYSESANSAYQRVVMRCNIRMALIPTEMERYFERTRLE